MVVNARIRREKLISAAEGYLMLNMPDQALAQLRTIDDPKLCSFDYYRLRGEALRDKKEYDRALSAYYRAWAEHQDDLMVLMGMAWCYKRVDRLPRAIEVMEEAYQSHPDEPIVLYNLSCYFALANNKPDALSWLGRALRMDSNLRKLIADELDFDSLRDDPDFQLIVGSDGGTSEASTRS